MDCGSPADGLPILDQHKQWWLKAIQALLEVKQFGLDRFADYVLQTREAIEDGHPMLSALGVALPALHLPRDTGFFRSLTDKTAGHLSKWKALYTQCDQEALLLSPEADAVADAAAGRRFAEGV